MGNFDEFRTATQPELKLLPGKGAQNNAPLPRAKGCYILVLFLAQPQTLQVGKLGELTFAAGYYLYVGSAFGSGGLAARLKHHLSSAKLHWHIDTLRAVAALQEIWFSVADDPCECQWAARLADLPQLTRPYPGFGSSDCRCVSHLFYCPTPQAFSLVQRTVKRNGLQKFAWEIRLAISQSLVQ